MTPGICPICRNKRILKDDYSKEGQIRGKICKDCKYIITWAKEDPEAIMQLRDAMVEYEKNI